MRNVYFTSLLMLCMSVHVKAGDWMKRLPDNLFVSQVSIPGTHDAATGNGVTLASYSQCQDIDVATQWSIGIRAFDFRPKVKGDYLNINHGIAVTNLRFDDALYLLRDSLKEHPSGSIVCMPLVTIVTKPNTKPCCANYCRVRI